MAIIAKVPSEARLEPYHSHVDRLAEDPARGQRFFYRVPGFPMLMLITQGVSLNDMAGKVVFAQCKMAVGKEMPPGSPPEWRDGRCKVSLKIAMDGDEPTMNIGEAFASFYEQYTLALGRGDFAATLRAGHETWGRPRPAEDDHKVVDLEEARRRHAAVIDLHSRIATK